MGPPREPHLRPQRQQPRRRRPPLIAAVIAVLVVGGGAVAAYKLRQPHSGSPGATSPTAAVTVPTSEGAAATPESVVKQFYALINAHKYGAAWQLDNEHNGETLQQWEAGYIGTKHDRVTITPVADDEVRVRIAAEQDNGTVKHYSGTYTVVGGKITSSYVLPVTG